MINDNLIPFINNKLQLGNKKNYWKDIYVSNIISNNNLKLEIQQNEKLEKNSILSIETDSSIPKSINIISLNGGIYTETLLNKIKTQKYELDSQDIKIENSNNLWFNSKNIYLETSNNIDIKSNSTKNSNVNIASIYGNIKLTAGNNQLNSIELSSLKGGMLFSSGKLGMNINSMGDININSNRNISIGSSNSLNKVLIGNTSGEVTIGNDLKVGGRIITGGEQRVEQLDSIRIETDEMLIELGKNNCNSLLDCGLIGNTGPEDKFGIYYHSMDNMFIFAEKMGENDNGIFSEPIKYGNLKVNGILSEKMELLNGGLHLTNKLSINNELTIDNVGNVETHGIIQTNKSLIVKDKKGYGIVVDTHKQLTRIVGDLWLNKININKIYQYQIGNALLWNTIQDCINNIIKQNHKELYTINIWNNQVYRETILITTSNMIIDGGYSTLYGSIIIDINEISIANNSIVIKNLTINSEQNQLPIIMIKCNNMIKIKLENIKINNSHSNNKTSILFVEGMNIKLNLENCKIKNSHSTTKVIIAEGKLKMKVIDSELRNKPLLEDMRCIVLDNNDNIVEINRSIIDGIIEMDGEKCSIKDSEWNTINEPHLLINNTMGNAILSTNKIINLSSKKSYDIWVTMPNDLKIVFKFYGNRFLGLNEDYLLSLNNVKSYLLPQGSTHINGIFSNSYKQYIIKKNDIIITSDHTYSELLIGNEMLNNNLELLGKLENGKMLGQSKILLVTKCCANYYLQYNSNGVITLTPDTIENIRLVWNGKIWIKW